MSIQTLTTDATADRQMQVQAKCRSPKSASNMLVNCAGIDWMAVPRSGKRNHSTTCRLDRADIADSALSNRNQMPAVAAAHANT